VTSFTANRPVHNGISVAVVPGESKPHWIRLIAISNAAPSRCLPPLLDPDVQQPQALTLIAVELDPPLRREPNSLDSIEAEPPADDLPIAQQKSLAADHRIREAEFAEGLLDGVLDRADRMVHHCFDP
jgi:hypothetical protein